MKSSYQATPPTDKWQRMAKSVNAPSDQELQAQFRRLVWVRWIVSNFVSMSLQYAGLIISTLIAPFNLLWFAAGTACGLVFMRGFRILPGIWLGSFLAYYLLKSGVVLAVGSATLYTAQAFLLVWISWRYITVTLVFYQRTIFWRFVVLTLLMTAAISLGLVYLHNLIFPSTLGLGWQWLTEWLANFNGVLVFALALITLDTYFAQITALKRLRKIPLCGSYGLLLAIIVALMVLPTPPFLMVLSLLTLLLFYFIGKKYGWCGFVAALFLVGLSLGLGALLGAPVYRIDMRILFIGQLLFAAVIIVGGFLTIRSTRVSLIVAMSSNRVIGMNNRLPWRLPADLQHFKQITWGKPIIMGRKTYDSIGKALPGRHNIVVTRNPQWQALGCETATSLPAALALAGNVREVLIIGGALLFAEAFLQADRLYLTEIQQEFSGDCFFPFDYTTGWQQISAQDCQPDANNPYHYRFITLQRVKGR